MKPFLKIVVGLAGVFQGRSAPISFSEDIGPKARGNINHHFGLLMEGTRGTITKFAAECFTAQSDPQIVTLNPTLDPQLQWALGAVPYGKNEISISGSVLKSNQVLRTTLEHELVHAVFGIVHSKSSDISKYHPILPYHNKQEKARYKLALKEFNTGLQTIKDELISFLDHTKTMEPSHQAQMVVHSLRDSHFIGPTLATETKVGEHIEMTLSVTDSHGTPHKAQVIAKVIEAGTPIKNGATQELAQVALKIIDLGANALALINGYESQLKRRTAEDVPFEQPTIMIEYLGPALEDLSPKMYDYMMKKMRQCFEGGSSKDSAPTKLPSSPQGAPLRNGNGIEL
jgi:hypothetical protein